MTRRNDRAWEAEHVEPINVSDRVPDEIPSAAVTTQRESVILNAVAVNSHDDGTPCAQCEHLAEMVEAAMEEWERSRVPTDAQVEAAQEVLARSAYPVATAPLREALRAAFRSGSEERT